ncbi:aladin [Contarinia nasturtii]|uniref:aladin n=1 Tax=Contarinia nasturtii TaxID=265458 RepID=UPI0012D47A47|nr:aladin [Contarinia nasturtii]
MDHFSCTLPLIEGEIINNDFNRSTTKLATYPDIYIRREGLIGSTHSIPFGSRYNLDRAILITPQNEPLPKRLARIFFEEGPTEALREAELQTQDQPINYLFRGLNFALCKLKHLNQIFWPYRNNENVNNLSEFVQTRDWQNSPIRCIRWHPNYFKLAVASVDDNIKIYSSDTVTITTLKHGYQKCITSLAWRPLCAGELAVGCNNGIIIWKLDTPGRHTSQYLHLTSINHHPISSLEWNRNGSLLVSVSLSDPNAIIWDVDTNRNIPLKRIGMPCAIAKWSPDNQRLFTSTAGSVFRVWQTSKWTPERWTIPTGAAIQSAVWSPCSNHLLFITTTDTILYSLCFLEEQIYRVAAAAKQSFPIADFKPVQFGQRTIGGLPKSIVWDQTGRFVAVMFKTTSSISVFSTSINRNVLSISPNFNISGDDADEFPSFICFKEKYEKHDDVVLTIGWSTGRIQYFPIR